MEVSELQWTFNAMHGFPGVVGAFDCTHIRIRAPSQHEEAYVNRHLYHSINAQLVVDASSRAHSVVVKWPGSVHDARIFAASGLAVKFDSSHRQGIILGDSGYPRRPWLMTPFRTPNTQGKLPLQPCTWHDSSCGRKVRASRVFTFPLPVIFKAVGMLNYSRIPPRRSRSRDGCRGAPERREARHGCFVFPCAA